MAWDNLNTHLAAGLKQYEAEHDWLTTVRLPSYAPDLNPRRGRLVTRTQSDGQHRLRHTRRPRPHTPPRVTHNPTPAPPDQRLSHRHRPDTRPTDHPENLSNCRPRRRV
ncbi:hypothetical protein [Streptomyces sp. NBC_00047]|uniref:hypothetical protein n=1 Tax=Streptomyces sp. NBC_00047 TaxID=2975627 RepID=UPI002B1DB017|nr:hypothetical protein [Streptomyces sp. NBC_00047]